MPDERFALPELMASLRAFGSSRRMRHGAAEHPRFFAPLLEARKAAAKAATAADVVALFDGTALVGRLDAVLRAFAEERFPSRPPARRAFEAELTDAVEPLRLALTRLADRAPAAVVSPAGADWERWLAQLRAVFAIADAVWPLVDAALEQQPPSAPPPRAARSRA